MWPFRKSPTESRSADLDVGATYAALFGFAGGSYAFQISPAVLAGSLTSAGGLDSIITESRRMARVSPLLKSYLRTMGRNLICAEPEAPEFPEGVPANTATKAAELWLSWHDVDRERDHLQRIITDGEFLLVGDDPGELALIPADGYEPAEAGPDWMKEVTGYKIGKGTSVRRASDSLLYVGDRCAGESRAMPWVGTALPYAAALAATRISAAHGLSALSRIAAVVENSSPDRIAAQPAGRSGVVTQDRAAAGADGNQPITSVGVGSVPYMRLNEAINRIKAGPDDVAQKYERLLELDVASALNLPLIELKGDYSAGGSFSNLRMAWTDAQDEYRDRRTWWHRNYRIPVWRRMLDAAWMNGKLPRMSRDVLTALRMPTWPGPVPTPPAPEKEAMTAKMLVEAGIIDPEQAEKLENLL